MFDFFHPLNISMVYNIIDFDGYDERLPSGR